MNFQNKKVSVIMGIYNCASTLDRSIASILAQTYTNWELILCDDGSSDTTFQIAKKYSDAYPDQITLISNDRNMGLAFSLNQCLYQACGEYIARMDGDDICFSTRFQKQVAYLDTHPEIGVVGGGFIPYCENREYPVKLPEAYPTKSTLLKSIPFCHPTIMMRKSIYDTLGGYIVSDRTRKGQDLDLWFRFFAKGFHGYNLQEPLIHYHEDIADYKKKRTVKAALGMVKTRWLGFKMLNFPIHQYAFTVRPLISAILPKSIMHRYHNT